MDQPSSNLNILSGNFLPIYLTLLNTREWFNKFNISILLLVIYRCLDLVITSVENFSRVLSVFKTEIS